MRRRLQLSGAVALLALLGIGGAAVAGGGGPRLSERLTGYEEVPAISTTGTGTFEARFGRFDDELRYRLSYRALEGDVQQAHIHLAQEGVNGGVSVWLCGNRSTTPPINPPEGTPACPPAPATVTGEIGPEDVVGPTGQGIEPGAFDELVDAIEAGVTYVNVHSSKWPGGEIRAQLDGRGRRGRD